MDPPPLDFSRITVTVILINIIITIVIIIIIIMIIMIVIADIKIRSQILQSDVFIVSLRKNIKSL